MPDNEETAPDNSAKKHTGGCHCGAVRFEVMVDASASSLSSKATISSGWRLAGRSSATTSSRSVTRMVSPALAMRTYSPSLAFSILMPTAFTAQR